MLSLGLGEFATVGVEAAFALDTAAILPINVETRQTRCTRCRVTNGVCNLAEFSTNAYGTRIYRNKNHDNANTKAILYF